MSYSRWMAAIAVASIFAGSLSAQVSSTPRKLGDGVLNVIPPQILPEETRTYIPKIKGLSPPVFTPETAPIAATAAAQARNIVLRRQIGCLEFAFTPLTVKVMEVPQPTGKMQRKTIWYLPFRVRNLGQHFNPALLTEATQLKFTKETITVPEVSIEDKSELLGKDNKFLIIPETTREESSIDVTKISDDARIDYKTLQTDSLKRVDSTDRFAQIDRFFAKFILEGRVQTDYKLNKVPTDRGLREDPNDKLMSKYTKKSYLDRVIPSVLDQIRQLEDPDTTFYDVVTLSRMKIPANPDPNSAGVWGVAIWEDLDPRLDFVTISVMGLSNAFQVFELPSGQTKIEHKALQLNFWRPGDIHDEEDDRIRYGIPLTKDAEKQKEICQFYDLPGPVIAVEEFDAKTDRTRELFIVEGEINDKFELNLRKGLDAGSLPKEIGDKFTIYGIPVPAGTPVQKLVEAEDINKNNAKEGIRWETSVDIDGVTRNFRFLFRPRSWQKVGEGIQIIKRVEHVWTYR